jgi:23S rRNA-intervening sequence protein
MERIRSYKDVRVYQAAIEAAMRVFELTKKFPAEERFSMVDQMRRSSRSVCSNNGEAWRKRRGQLVRLIDRPDQWTLSKRKA